MTQLLQQCDVHAYNAAVARHWINRESRDSPDIGESRSPGEVTQYLATCDDLKRIDESVFDRSRAAIVNGGYPYFKNFFNSFRDTDELAPTAARLPALVAHVKLVPVEGGPHDIEWTFPEEVDLAVLEFVCTPARTPAP